MRTQKTYTCMFRINKNINICDYIRSEERDSDGVLWAPAAAKDDSGTSAGDDDAIQWSPPPILGHHRHNSNDTTGNTNTTLTNEQTILF